MNLMNSFLITPLRLTASVCITSHQTHTNYPYKVTAYDNICRSNYLQKQQNINICKDLKGHESPIEEFPTMKTLE